MNATVVCQTCGAELQDAAQRFCGGDRCLGDERPKRIDQYIDYFGSDRKTLAPSGPR